MSRFKPAICILAAGASRRMGRPKQLLQFKDKPLIRYIWETCQKTKVPVFVILGCHSGLIKKELPPNAEVIINKNWETGLSSSIHLAIQQLSASYSGILFCTVDQPHLSTEHLNSILQTAKDSDDQAVASFYSNIYGIPAWIPKRFFPELLDIQGDRGAGILLNRSENVLSVNFNKGEIDLDTEADVKKFGIN